MMEQSEQDAGTITALMLRMEKSRLPRAKRMLEKVNDGKTLSDLDIQFLKRVHADYRANQALIKRNPRYRRIMSGVTDLYNEIITKGLENEEAQ